MDHSVVVEAIGALDEVVAAAAAALEQAGLLFHHAWDGFFVGEDCEVPVGIFRGGAFFILRSDSYGRKGKCRS